jgi:PAS domain S-box-containing protein
VAGVCKAGTRQKETLEIRQKKRIASDERASEKEDNREQKETMELFGTTFDLAMAINALTAMACCLLGVEYIIRKPPYPWSSYSVSFILFALACDRILKIVHPDLTFSIWQWSSQYFLDSLIMLAACMIPVVRQATYKRPKFKQVQEIYEDLKYNQSLFQNYLDEAPVLAYIKDKEGRVKQINDGFKRLFGDTASDFIGRTHLWGDPAVSLMRDQQILAGHGEKETMESLPSSDGERTILDIRFPLVGPENESLLGGIAVDMTNQLKRKNRIEVLASIVDFSPDAIYSHDLNGRVLTWNPAAEVLFGYSREEMIGQSVTKIMGENNQDELQNMSMRFSQDPATSQTFESTRLSKTGMVIKVLVAAAYVPSREPAIAVIARDITQRKNMEIQLGKLHDISEAKVRELSKLNVSLQKARDEALEAAGIRSAFVASISHELRTPLSGILGMSELLARKSLDSDSQRLVNLMRESALRLLHVIEDILDLARLEAGKITAELEKFSLEELILECEEHFAPALKAKNLTWKVTVDSNLPQQICSDHFILKRILCHLIANAVTFTTSGGIEISVSIEDRKEGSIKLRFSITDTGIGIEPEVLAQMFTPFAKVSRSAEGVPGKGLGLNLCKQLAPLLQGELGCTSEKDRGATFWFTATVLEPEALNVPPKEYLHHQSMSPDELSKCVALSVDDSPVVSQLTMRQLDIIGIQSMPAISGLDAIDRVANQTFDVILMDVHLPDMTGYEAAVQIRELEKSQGKSRSIIIALSGCTAAELREQTDLAVMDDILEKPVSIELLRSSLFRALSQRPSSGQNSSSGEKAQETISERQ